MSSLPYRQKTLPVPSAAFCGKYRAFDADKPRQ
jgi:hypothetical protein